MSTRRKFLQRFPALLSVPLLMPQTISTTTLGGPLKNYAPNDQINLACIGMGIQGFNDVNAALKNPGIKMVAACDLYDGRLARAREVYGNDVFVTRDYQKILEREDVDAVIIATSDHWHDAITIAALDADKHVYCEKPLVQSLVEGHPVLEAEQRSKGVLIVGSQGVSSILTEKAREIYQRGELGKLVMIETFNDRFSANGAWQYSIPRDASTDTVDWNTFLKDTQKMPFDKTRFFRWRNYQAYGTGVGGDLFVHLFSESHRVLDSLGPNRIFATGYGQQTGHPAFNMQLRVNFVAGGGGDSKTRFVGTEGSLELGWNSITLKRNKLSAAPGYGGWDTFGTFSEPQRKEFEQWYKAKYPPALPEVEGPKEWTYRTPEGYSDHVHHFNNWFTAIRKGGKVVEDGAFGFRAAAPSLAANLSYFEKKVVEWDPVNKNLHPKAL